MGNFSRRQTDDIFHIFSKKLGFDISCKLSPEETICMKCQVLVSGNYKKKYTKTISKSLLLNFLPSMQSVTEERTKLM